MRVVTVASRAKFMLFYNHPRTLPRKGDWISSAEDCGPTSDSVLPRMDPPKTPFLWDVNDSIMGYRIEGRDVVGNVRRRSKDRSAVGIRRRHVPKTNCCLRNNRSEEEERRAKNDECTQK